MFFLSNTDEYGFSEIVDQFDSPEEAESALNLLENALEDGPSCRIKSAIDQLKNQLNAYYQAD